MDGQMNSALIAVIVEQYNKIVELESQIFRLNQAVEALAEISDGGNEDE